MVAAIIEELDPDNGEVFVVDETHVSTEPYVAYGWQKKGPAS